MAQDPYRYFRIEARELIEQLTQGILLLPKAPFDAENVTRLLRYAHTLKGAARVVKQLAIAEACHALEELLQHVREQSGVSDAELAELLSVTDRIADKLKELAAPPAEPAAAAPAEKSVALPVAAAAPPVVEESFHTLRVEVDELDVLLRGVIELGVRLGALQRDLRQLEDLGNARSPLFALLEQITVSARNGSAQAADKARSQLDALFAGLEQVKRGLAANVGRVAGELADLRDAAQEIRLLPAHSVFPSLTRAVHDAGQTLGKRVELVTAGGEIRLDAHVLGMLRDALLHIVRNAVAHGIEAPSERSAARKPALGRIALRVERRGARVVFHCSDDGRGVDAEAVRKTAIQRGILPASKAQALTADEVLRAIMSPGFSTAANVDEISGRGIGLDVVRATVQRLKGEVELQSTPDQGTTISLDVPISVAAIAVLLVEAGGAVHALPLSAVRSALSVKLKELSRVKERDALVHDGQLVPFITLERLLQLSSGRSANRKAWSAVILGNADRSIALGVDRVLGTSQVVVRPLPAQVSADPIVAGAALDAEGNPELVLDPAALVARAETELSSEHSSAPPTKLPILVIDDSLTTRMLEQSILESAGYEVQAAVSAEEGLELARRRRYGLFVVDVDMPGMNGFQFVEQTRADPELRATPAILVTSRDSAEDKRRGAQAGARAYVVKGEFEQGHLLHLISSLMD